MTKDQETTLAWAVAAHQKGDLNQAEARYLAYLDHFEECPNGHHFLGVFYAQQGLWTQAMTSIKRAVELDPKNASYHNSLGNCHKAQKNYNLAVPCYQTALLLKPDYASPTNNLGTIYQHQNAFDKAASIYRQALVINPNSPDPHYNLGLCALHQNNPEQALQSFDACRQLAPDHLKINLMTGVAYLQLNQFSQAKSCFEAQIAIDPNCHESHFHLGQIAFQTDQFSEALTAFERTIALKPDHLEANHYAGTCHMALQQLSQALPHYLFVLQHHPHHLDALYNIGVIYMAQDKHQQSIEFFQQVISLDPNHYGAQHNLAGNLIKMGHYDQAITQYQQLASQYPEQSQYPFILAGLRQKNPPANPPQAFVVSLFDHYAPHYDAHLSQSLHYDVPEQLHKLFTDFTDLDTKKTKLTVLDVGCGTGLCGPLFKPISSRLIGIDLSPNMLAIAESKQCYDDLQMMDALVLTDHFQAIDLILAADVLPYFGDLQGLLTNIANSLAPKGIALFSFEASHKTESYHLQQTLRYAHNKHYVIDCCQQLNLTIIQTQNAVLRLQNNKPLYGYLFMVQKG